MACSTLNMGVCSVPRVQANVNNAASHASNSKSATELASAWQVISAEPTTYNFQTFAITASGTYVASPVADQLGRTVTEVLSSSGVTGMTGAQYLAYLQSAADQPNGKNWVAYSFMMGGATVSVKAYVKEVTAYDATKYLIFSSFKTVAYPAAVPCTASNDAPCGTVNVNSVLGMAVASLTPATTSTEFDAALTAVTSNTTYRVQPTPDSGRFYTFVFTTAGVCKAHGGNSANVGKTLTAILTGLGVDTITGTVSVRLVVLGARR